MWKLLVAIINKNKKYFHERYDNWIKISVLFLTQSNSKL